MATVDQTIDSALRMVQLLGPGHTSVTAGGWRVAATDIFNVLVAGFAMDSCPVFGTSIDRYALLTPGFQLQSTYFIGPGLGPPDFNAPRPLWIEAANIVLTGTSPEQHIPMTIVRTAGEWARERAPERQSSRPYLLFCDYMNTGTAAKLHLEPVPTQNNDLELFTTRQLTSYGVGADLQLADAYSDALRPHLALRFLSEFAWAGAKMDPQVLQMTKEQARSSKASIQRPNLKRPYIDSDIIDPRWPVALDEDAFSSGRFLFEPY